MSESKAVEDYKIFESLRNRFSDATSPPPRPEPRKASKRRFDPRNAPPLVPLIEEGDQLQEAMVSGSASPSRVKWKYTNQLKCNHLNGPDFDALDTSSTTSLSSAYSEPGTSSPVMGSSLSELSDAGSCETFSEYDIKRNKQQLQSRIASLKASFEHSSLDQSQNRSPKHKNDSFDVDVSGNFVHKNKRAWDRVIGDWVFNGVDPHSPASSLKPKMRPPSSEVRVPTPLSTPLGSTDNLLIDSGSRSSVLSTNDSIISSEDYTNGWNFEQSIYTRRSLSNFPRRPSSASCIQNQTKRQSLITVIKDDNRSSSETDLLLQMTPLRKPTQKDNATLEREGTEKECDEEVVYLQPKEYKMGKFLSISDTMLPAEERTHEYIAEGTEVSSQGEEGRAREEENVGDEPITDYSSQRFATSTEQPPQAKEVKTEDGSTEIPPDSAAMTEVKLGTFLSQNNTNFLPEEVNDVEADQEKPTSLAITDSDNDKKSADEKVSKTEESRLEPSNRWFDAYMKCKASQATAGLVRKRIPPVIKEDPVQKSEKKEEAEVKEPPVNASQVNMDDFEKVQKITPSKSQKWREAMEKYKALEQKSASQNPQASRGEEQSQNSVVKSPQKSAEEPTYSSLAQRAQVFGGMRKKPPLRRAKSFQIGSGENASSPLATGLTRPTRVLKRQMTASSFN